MTDYGCPICHRITCQCGPRQPTTEMRIAALEKRLTAAEKVIHSADRLLMCGAGFTGDRAADERLWMEAFDALRSALQAYEGRVSTSSNPS